MKFLLFLFIIVLLIQFIKFLNIKEHFDNNCFYNYTPDFTLNISDTFTIEENGEISLNSAGHVVISTYNAVNESRNNDLNIDKINQDISAILEYPFDNSLLKKETCKFNY